MGLAKKKTSIPKSTSNHKQDNLFMYFPMYVCLGIYYILEFCAAPFLWMWNFSSTSIYKAVNKVSKDSTEFRGADL